VKSLLVALRYAQNLWPYYVGVSVASLLVALTGLAIPFVIKSATDLMVNTINGGATDISGAAWLASLLLLFDVAGTLIRNYGGYLGDMLAIKLRVQLSTRYYDQLLSLPQSYYDSELTGTIINRLNRAITEVTNFLNMFANNFFSMVLTSILTIGIVAFYSWPLALLTLALYPLFLYLTGRTSKKWQRLQNTKNIETDIASGRFAEVVTQIKIVKSYVQEKLEYNYFQKRLNKTVNLTDEQSRYWHKMDVARGMVLSVIFFAMYLIIFLQTVQKQFTIGEMILLITLLNGIRMPLFSLSFVIDQFQRAITGSRDFVMAMRIEPEIKDIPHATRLAVTEGAICYSGVDFSYTKKQRVLRNITLDIPAGEKMALVGESGEGKTTVSNLLMRLYEPTKGTITIDGKDISSVTQKSLRSNIATVFQDPALFSGTIRENITYGQPGISDTQIKEVAKSANAHDFIEKLEKGYDSEIGERGIKLSGGQKQRIAIARAMLKNAPILILDEATSSLDSRAEQHVQHALDNLMKGRTTMIIAHRLSTIASVDMVVTLKNGTIDEVGTPAELAQTDGLYAQLLALQAGSTETARKKLRTFEISS